MADTTLSGATTLLVDPTRTRLQFRAKAFGLRWVTGTLTVASGELRFAEDGVVHATGTASAQSVTTGIAARDRHLRHRHYLHAHAHPHIVLAGTFDASGTVAHGELRARGAAAPVTLVLDVFERRDDELRLRAHGSFDRSPLRMLPPLAGVSRVVHIDIDVVARPSA